jgi:hypothetical protein
MHYPTKIDMDTLVSIREKKSTLKLDFGPSILSLFLPQKKNQGGACEGWEKRTIHAASIL